MDQSLIRHLRGPHTFLLPDGSEVGRLFPEIVKLLPLPRGVHLKPETATPLIGFPVLESPELGKLLDTLRNYLRAEEVVQYSIIKGRRFDQKKHASLWEAHKALLLRVSENVTTSNYGRDYPQIFWLFQSLEIAAVLNETPKRIRRHDVEVGREHGDSIKYAVLFRYFDRVFPLLYDLADRLSSHTDEQEESLFPSLLTHMRDNVLIFTEDRIGRNLEELGSYFRGYLKLNDRSLKEQFHNLQAWHSQLIQQRGSVMKAVRALMPIGPELPPEDFLLQPGYLRFLSTLEGYDPERFFDRNGIQTWEGLLLKLKEFELLDTIRRLIVRMTPQGDAFLCSEKDASRLGGGTAELQRITNTRPLDFMAPWVVDPEVMRGGLIYDITDFSATVSRLSMSDRQAQDDSFRSIFRFQRRFDRIAQGNRVKWEKYLGDGSFYSGRNPRRMLIAAIAMQRYYSKAVSEGFPFDRGMRMALNYGQYRLMPFGSSSAKEVRYEVFGQGVIELSRLVSGKTSRDLDDIKTALVAKGYPEATVNMFFAPLTKQNVDLVDKLEEARPFYAYLNRNGTLINEGIVATARFIAELDRVGGIRAAYRVTEGDRHYVAVALETADEDLVVGLRRLGLAQLKGLERLAVYEVVDGQEWELAPTRALSFPNLLDAVNETFTSALAGT